MPQQAKPTGDESQRDQHLPRGEEQHKAGDIGGEIDQLYSTAGPLQTHFAQPGIQHQQKGAGTRPVQAIIQPDDKRKTPPLKSAAGCGA